MNNYIGAHIASSSSLFFFLKEQVTLDTRNHLDTFVNSSEERIQHMITSLFYRILSRFKITNPMRSESRYVRFQAKPNPNQIRGFALELIRIWHIPTYGWSKNVDFSRDIGGWFYEYKKRSHYSTHQSRLTGAPYIMVTFCSLSLRRLWLVWKTWFFA